MRKGSNGVPVYLIDPGLDELKLVQLIASNHPIYSVEIPWLSAWHGIAARNETEGLPTVEQIVAPYVAAIKAHANSSRCVLGGHSFGGVMAFEVARQLSLININVVEVLLLDTAADYPGSHEVAWKKLKQIWFPVANNVTAVGRLSSSLWIMKWMLADKTRILGGRVINAVKRRRPELTTRLDDTGKPVAWPLIKYVYDNAIKSYRMSQLDCRGVLFRAEWRQDSDSRNLEQHLGWDGLFLKGLEIVVVPGGHMTMMRQPHASVLAREMGRTLGRISAEGREASHSASEQCSEPPVG